MLKKSNSLRWVFISLGGFLLFVVCFYFLIQNNKQINISLPVYFILLTFIALIATAFLAGAMKSVATYNLKTQNRSLYLSGPAVIFFIILYIGYKYRPIASEGALTLTLIFTEKSKTVKVINSGVVNIKTGLYFSTKRITDDGTVFFTGINSDYKGKAVDISVDVPGYSLNADSVYRLSETDNDTQYTIHLTKEQDLVNVKGRVIKLPMREGLANVSVQFEKLNNPVTTDSSGNFSAIIPVKSGTEIRVIAINHKKEIYNSLVNVYDGQLLSIGVEEK